MMARKKHQILAGVLAVATLMSACQSKESPTPAPTQAETQPGDDITDAQALDTDMSDPDAVAHDFVEVIESHNASNEVNEWVSLSRAESLMVADTYEANMEYTEGDVYSDWELWKELNATTTPIVSVQSTEGEKDSPSRVHRTAIARINVSAGAGAEGKAAPARMRVHELILTNNNGKWLVDRWEVHRMQDNDAQQAGES